VHARHSTSGLRLLAAALTAAAVLWAAAVCCTSRNFLRDSVPGLTAVIHATGSLVCHQRPERSFHTDGRRFAVCARCTGLYLSGAFGALAAWLGRARLPRNLRLMLAAAAIPTIVTVAAEWLAVAWPSNAVRAGAALPLGAMIGWTLVRLLRTESARALAL
jgi:uncharacterized membrane protein